MKRCLVKAIQKACFTMIILAANIEWIETTENGTDSVEVFINLKIPLAHTLFKTVKDIYISHNIMIAVIVVIQPMGVEFYPLIGL